MIFTKSKSFIFVSIIVLLNLFNSNNLVQSKQNSILKTFCIQSVKKEMRKAELAYSEEIANETCECYYEEFIQTSSHKYAKTKCKLEAQKSLKS